MRESEDHGSILPEAFYRSETELKGMRRTDSLLKVAQRRRNTGFLLELVCLKDIGAGVKTGATEVFGVRQDSFDTLLHFLQHHQEFENGLLF